MHFFLTFIFLNGTFYPMHILGVVGFPRRLADPYHYETFRHLLPLNQFMTWCAILMVAVADHLRRQLLLQHVLRPAGRAGIRGTPTGWNGRRPARRATATSISSRSIYRGPYEYGSPEVDTDYYPQTQPPPPERPPPVAGTLGNYELHE